MAKGDDKGQKGEDQTTATFAGVGEIDLLLFEDKERGRQDAALSEGQYIKDRASDPDYFLPVSYTGRLIPLDELGTSDDNELLEMPEKGDLTPREVREKLGLDQDPILLSGGSGVMLPESYEVPEPRSMEPPARSLDEIGFIDGAPRINPDLEDTIEDLVPYDHPDGKLEDVLDDDSDEPTGEIEEKSGPQRALCIGIDGKLVDPDYADTIVARRISNLLDTNGEAGLETRDIKIVIPEDKELPYVRNPITTLLVAAGVTSVALLTAGLLWYQTDKPNREGLVSLNGIRESQAIVDTKKWSAYECFLPTVVAPNNLDAFGDCVIAYVNEHKETYAGNAESLLFFYDACPPLENNVAPDKLTGASEVYRIMLGNTQFPTTLKAQTVEMFYEIGFDTCGQTNIPIPRQDTGERQ